MPPRLRQTGRRSSIEADGKIPMILSENYFRDRADDCNRLAREESDLEMRGMLCDLELDYRAKALHAAAHGWRDAPRYFELAEA
jgi:hypothetical protein